MNDITSSANFCVLLLSLNNVFARFVHAVVYSYGLLLDIFLGMDMSQIICSFLGGAWVAQLVKHLTLSQVMISWFMSSRWALC